MLHPPADSPSARVSVAVKAHCIGSTVRSLSRKRSQRYGDVAAPSGCKGCQLSLFEQSRRLDAPLLLAQLQGVVVQDSPAGCV